MEGSSTDLRVIRTKEAIRNALIELIDEKGFDAITIKDLTTRAKINRGTFYAHYQDKYDLMVKCQDEMMLEMSKLAKKDLQNFLTSANQTLEMPFPFALTIFKYLDTNKSFMKAVLGPKGDLSFQTRLKNFIWKTMFEDEANSPIKDTNLLIPKQYLAAYIVSAHIGVIQQWLVNNGEESPLEMAKILTTLTIDGPFLAAGFKK